MSVRIRLKRYGTKRKPFYRIVVVDSRAPRDGKVLEEVGLYQPIEKKDRQVTIREDKVNSWLAKGATPSDTVRQILARKAKA